LAQLAELHDSESDSRNNTDEARTIEKH